MKAQIKQTIILEMTTEQAEWLQTLMQNPLSNDPDPENEDPINSQNRADIWHALNELV